MLSDAARNQIDREIQREIRKLSSPLFYDRSTVLQNIKELKSLLDEEMIADEGEEIVISLDELIDTVRDLFRRKKHPKN